MIKSAEKIQKPSASGSVKQMQKNRFRPSSFESTEMEHEEPAGMAMPSFSYNL
jgi:hypothetical protein